MGQHYMDTSAPPIFALELAEAIVHIQVKWVYAGAWAPHPRVTSADFLTLIYLWNPSYLS